MFASLHPRIKALYVTVYLVIKRLKCVKYIQKWAESRVAPQKYISSVCYMRQVPWI